MYLRFTGHLDEALPEPATILADVSWTRHRLVVLDFSEADSAAPRGLEWIEQFAAKALGAGFRIRVVAPEGTRIRRTLELLRFDRFLTVEPTVRKALRVEVFA